ncbi:MAG: DsbA family protein [Actinobacteria bacterium]|nr:DsbA family protein [Actinomycetota bacterium]
MTTTVELFFDPVCPFCWVTSRWLRRVEHLTDIEVTWRFISLAVLNEAPGAYDDRPALYPEVHGLGRDLLRVAAATRAAAGDDTVRAGDDVDRLYLALGDALWETASDGPIEEFDDVLEAVAERGRDLDLAAVLAAADLPTELAAARDDASWDAVVRRETEEALARVGGDVGTPIITVGAPDGPSFFGPVISDDPADDDAAVEAWEAFVTLAELPGFAEVKRSLRAFPATALTEPLAGEATRAS